MTNDSNDPLPFLAVTKYPITNDSVVYNPNGFSGTIMYDMYDYLLTAQAMKTT